MLTASQIIEHASAADSRTIDGRDLMRLSRFFHHSEWHKLGITIRDGVDPSSIPDPVEFTEKALNRRDISAGSMFEVVKMWMWVLEDDLQNFSDDDYAQYGLPLFKAVAVKYNLNNPIGDDAGDEASKYSQDAEWPD